jgi:hypothetical protein
MFLYDVQGRLVEHFAQEGCDSKFPADKRTADACVIVSTGEKTVDCADNDNQCAYWVKKGECERNPKYMLKNCQKGCKVCSCKKGPSPEYTACKNAEKTCNEKFPPDKRVAANAEVCKTADNQTIFDCLDSGKHCAYWKSQGECEKNPNYMKAKCKKTCGVCTCKKDGNSPSPEYMTCMNANTK